ncbi:sulfatase family protein [Rubellicoccus peritrichatus]|uniref:Sulfatase-like hydrolase/transferase n=1 Tax=Rubellicoccus peritrichatus TaxID=3080537 RepID=A0AAQ3QWJ8_9BACT|nr:sulfatase-like hydrolase/transferase [Puniceicoccus sp. CR14]WOO41940.1 sulfatase-like hydrolase/transferase [Puniceicoccus sp. CR14]
MPKNILLITSDQQHWDTLGAIGSPVKTPNLDKLASRGMIFDRAYCPNPTCTPTRASIITGQYPSQHGAWSLGTKLDERIPTVGQSFHDAGFATGLIGKAHFQPLKSTAEFPSLEAYPTLQDLQFWREFNQPFYGFHHVELARNHADEAHVGQHYAIWMEEKGCKNWRDYYIKPTGHTDGLKHVWPIPEEYHYNTWIAERSLAFMDEQRNGDQPFFLWSSFFDPHPPYLVPEPWASMYDPADIDVPEITPGEHDQNPPHFGMTQEEKPDFGPWREDGQGIHGYHSHLVSREDMAKNIAVYYGMISMMDHYIGKILDGLEERGLADDTLIVFTTDHGHFFGQHGLVAKGAFHYEDLIRVPFIAASAGEIPTGGHTKSLQSLVDLPTTFLAAAGIDAPRTMVGENQWPSWTGEVETVRDHVIVENRHQPTTIHVKTYVTDRYKITVYYNKDYGELFDLQEDPNELLNLWDSEAHQPLKNRLIKEFLFAEMGKEPMAMPRISGA